MNLFKKHIELLQQQVTGFQQPPSDVSANNTVETPAPAATPSPSQIAESLPTCTEPGTTDHATMMKGPDGSTKLQKQGSQEAKRPLFQAFQKAVLTAEAAPDATVPSSSGSQGDRVASGREPQKKRLQQWSMAPHDMWSQL